MKDLREEIRKTVRTVSDFPKPGIQFKDITPILERPILNNEIVAEFHRLFHDEGIDAIAGVESRGFLYGLPLAIALHVPFVIIRKKGKLPAETVSYKYDLEYGSAEMEMHKGSVKPGMNVLVHDDLLATGGTAAAAAKLIEAQGGEVAGFSFLIELLALDGRARLNEFKKPLVSLISYD